MLRHDLDIPRQKSRTPKIVVFEDAEMRATDAGNTGEALPDVSRGAEAAFVRSMTEARVAQVVKQGTGGLEIPIVQNDRPPIRIALGKKALKSAPQKSGTVERRYSHLDDRRPRLQADAKPGGAALPPGLA